MEQDKVGEYLEDQCLCEQDTAGVKYWKCAICDIYHNRKQDLLRHIESLHIQTSPYVCVYCTAQVEFKTKRALQRHVTASHKS